MCLAINRPVSSQSISASPGPWPPRPPGEPSYYSTAGQTPGQAPGHRTEVSGSRPWQTWRTVTKMSGWSPLEEPQYGVGYEVAGDTLVQPHVPGDGRVTHSGVGCHHTNLGHHQHVRPLILHRGETCQIVTGNCCIVSTYLYLVATYEESGDILNFF